MDLKTHLELEKNNNKKFSCAYFYVTFWHKFISVCVFEHTVAHKMVKYALKLLKDFSRMTSTRYTIAMMISGL